MLRSLKDIDRYTVCATDGDIGSVVNFLLDDDRWASRISWEERKVYVDLARQAIKNSPEWNANAAINREYETHL